MKKKALLAIILASMAGCKKENPAAEKTQVPSQEESTFKSTGDRDLDWDIKDFNKTTKEFYERNKGNACEEIKKNESLMDIQIKSKMELIVQESARLGFTEKKRDSILLVNNHILDSKEFAKCALWEKSYDLLTKLKSTKKK